MDYDVYVEEDDLFRLTLYIEKKQAKEYRHISIFSTFEYLGEDNGIGIVSMNPYYSYQITEGETDYITYNKDAINTESKLSKNIEYLLAIRIWGGFSSESSEAAYWRAFYNDEYIRLPEGLYDLTVSVDFSLGEDGEAYKKNIQKVIKVVK